MADVLDIVLIPDYLYAEMTPDRVWITAEQMAKEGEEPEPIQQTPGSALRNKLDEMDKAIGESRQLHAKEAKEKQGREEADNKNTEKQVQGADESANLKT